MQLTPAVLLTISLLAVNGCADKEAFSYDFEGTLLTAHRKPSVGTEVYVEDSLALTDADFDSPSYRKAWGATTDANGRFEREFNNSTGDTYTKWLGLFPTPPPAGLLSGLYVIVRQNGAWVPIYVKLGADAQRRTYPGGRHLELPPVILTDTQSTSAPVQDPSSSERQPADSANDPRPTLARFFDAIRHGNKAAALKYWNPNVDGDEQQQRYVAELVSRRVDELIAQYQFEQALADKLPDVYRQAKEAGEITPTATRLAAARFTLYRRLAIVNWGRDEDSGFPMEFDSRADQQRWKISMREWYTTNRSSVGDSLLMRGWDAKATAATTREILAGKLSTAEQVQTAYRHHMEQLGDDKAKDSTTPK